MREPSATEVARLRAEPSTRTSTGTRTRELLLARLLASVVSVAIVGLGIMDIWTRHYYGRTTKLRGAEVTVDGGPAVAMGVCTVLFGLFPLALWFRDRRPAIAWMMLCFITAGVAFYISLRL